MYMRLVEQRREVLLAALLRKAQQEGLPMAELAQQLDLPEDQLAAFVFGIERVENISRETARAAAAYLGWPVIGVWFAAGAVRLEDFFTPQTLQQAVGRARARWPALHTGTALCAVLALTFTNEELLPRHILRATVDERL